MTTPRIPDGCTRFQAPVVMNGWDNKTVLQVLEAGFVFIVDEVGEAIAVPMKTAIAGLINQGFAAADAERLRTMDRPFIRIDSRTPGRVQIGTLLRAHPMPSGGQA